MFGLDSWIAALGAGHPLILATVVAVLLGLRHATDPDHLSAVTALVAGDRDRRVAHAARMGMAWGGGHAFWPAFSLVPGGALLAWHHRRSKMITRRLRGRDRALPA